ncbi:hypothetical protein XHC_1682 [Xanthomonas hortorum pv. carotae str. M081]|nr:hypothetical protein XHC_1682 [Xanthomonas hortorum pv. carotae str. M081]
MLGLRADLRRPRATAVAAPGPARKTGLEAHRRPAGQAPPRQDAAAPGPAATRPKRRRRRHARPQRQPLGPHRPAPDGQPARRPGSAHLEDQVQPTVGVRGRDWGLGIRDWQERRCYVRVALDRCCESPIPNPRIRTVPYGSGAPLQLHFPPYVDDTTA